MGIENFGKNNSLDKKLALNDLSVKDLEAKLAEDARKAVALEEEKVAKQKDLDKKLAFNSPEQEWGYDERLVDSQKELNEELANRAKERIAGQKTDAEKLQEEIEKGIEER